MIQAKVAAWFAEKTLKFWLNLLGLALVATILVAPSCMYVNVKKDLKEANETIAQYEEAAKAQKKAQKAEVVKIEYRDKVIEKRVIQTKIKREIVYVNNEQAKDWGCYVIPDAVIGLREDDLSAETGQSPVRARALPDYCTRED